jgi:hypothetical protein
MVTEKEDHKAADVKKAPLTQPQGPKAPPPTQEELDKALQALVEKAEAIGQRDDPVVANARALLDRKSTK